MYINLIQIHYGHEGSNNPGITKNNVQKMYILQSKCNTVVMWSKYFQLFPLYLVKDWCENVHLSTSEIDKYYNVISSINIYNFK